LLQTIYMDTSLRPFDVIIAGSVIIFIIAAIFIILYYYYSRKMVMADLEKNQISLDYQKELLKNEIRVIEKERKRIARDLHDEVGANLSYVNLNLAQLEKSLPEDRKLNEKFQVCSTQLNKSIADVRRISHALLPPVLDMFGLIPAIQEIADNVESDIAISVEADDSFNYFDKDRSLQLYRIILEIINNSIKHSGGSKINIRFTSVENRKVIIAANDGEAFDFHEKIKTGGLGLKNIISRIESMDAEWSVPTLNEGFEIKIIINE